MAACLTLKNKKINYLALLPLVKYFSCILGNSLKCTAQSAEKQ